MIDTELLKMMASSTAKIVKDYFGLMIAPLTNHIDDLQKRLDAIRIPEAIKGDKGDSIKGDSGESAYEIAIKNGFEGSERDWLESLKGEKGESIKGDPGSPGEKGESVKGDPGESIKGDPGPMGLSAFQIAQNEGFTGTRLQWLESLKGEKGLRGEQGDPGESIEGPRGPVGLDAYQIARNEGFVGTRVQWLESLHGRDGQDGKNADPIHPDTIALMVTKEVQAAIAALPKPKDGDKGDPGRDALHIDILPKIDPQKSYARGTYALHQGGVICARRNTEPNEAIQASDWDVVMNGQSRVEWKQDESDPRRFVIQTRFTNDSLAEQSFRIPLMMFRDVFKEGSVYERGDVVRWDHSSWHCSVDKTMGVPGISPDWKLMVKRGDRGKDGKDLDPPKPQTPIRLGGNGSK